MSFLQLDFYSRTLGMDSQLNIVLPEEKQGGGFIPVPRKGQHPVLYLLHGTSGDHTDWERWTSVERYAAKKGIALVMVAGQLSSYTNMVYGQKFFDYIAYEVPEVVKDFFPISDKREDTFIAGLSMGSYGALKIALALPENYAAAGALSSGNHAYNPERFNEGKGGIAHMMGKNVSEVTKADQDKGIFSTAVLERRLKLCWGWEKGDSILNTEEDWFFLAKRNLEEGRPLPKIFHACGTEDHNWNEAVRARDFFQSLPGNPYQYEFHQGPGQHNWEFWDKWIEKFIQWLPVSL